jgi:hypothetical protein
VIQEIHARGGFFVDGFAGAPTERTFFRLVFVAFGGDGPALDWLLILLLPSCPIFPAVGGGPYFSPGEGLPLASAAMSAAAVKRVLNLLGLHPTPSALCRLAQPDGIWSDDPDAPYSRAVSDAPLHDTLLGKIVWYFTALFKVLAEHSHRRQYRCLSSPSRIFQLGLQQGGQAVTLAAQHPSQQQVYGQHAVLAAGHVHCRTPVCLPRSSWRQRAAVVPRRHR